MLGIGGTRIDHPRRTARICQMSATTRRTRQVLTVEMAAPTSHMTKRIKRPTVSPAKVETHPYSAVLAMTWMLETRVNIRQSR